MTQRTVLLMSAPKYTPPPPKFARKKGKGFEYGTVVVDSVDRTGDKYIVVGVAKTLIEAMNLNEMEPLCSGKS